MPKLTIGRIKLRAYLNLGHTNNQGVTEQCYRHLVEFPDMRTDEGDRYKTDIPYAGHHWYWDKGNFAFYRETDCTAGLFMQPILGMDGKLFVFSRYCLVLELTTYNGLLGQQQVGRGVTTNVYPTENGFHCLIEGDTFDNVVAAYNDILNAK